MKIEALETNIALINEGRWVKNIPVRGADDLELLVRGMPNEFYEKRFSELVRELPRAQQVALTQDEQNAIGNRVMAETVILGWRNMTRNGVELEYDPAFAAELMASKTSRFRECVMYACAQVTADAEVFVENGAKNLERPSGGKSAGAAKKSGSRSSSNRANRRREPSSKNQP